MRLLPFTPVLSMNWSQASMVFHANNEFLSTTLFTIPPARSEGEKRMELNEISPPARDASESFTAPQRPWFSPCEQVS